ncbi:hypothetical protein GF326_08660 [Candidatus Bathyarchaeota archaeon]|nr:hypothetical protein [Candidatus Bathyarchaeota archaeon]
MDLREQVKKIPEKIKKIPSAIKKLPVAIKEMTTGYIESYKKGTEKFGIWWKIFHLSIWGFVLIFIVTAVIIFVVYLPKIEMIYWELE